MVLHTGKKYILLVPSCYLPRVATEWHFTCLIFHLDLRSFHFQPLKFTYTLSLQLKNYSACCCYLQAVTGSPLNLPLDKTAKYLSFFSPTHFCLQVLLFFFEPAMIWWTVWGRWNCPKHCFPLLTYRGLWEGVPPPASSYLSTTW